ncbi:hypothetical protein JQC92_20110 [Shewanella sp. 202IG2-18]|uniref:hypothetical protein n=1 Tax=Parashewanella hymeniacidonis TaxID=2807618 RepID=UPI001961068A|nr:hypothetical protein [Parashewanella hymeniacidonis]MBM7074298.1 hypothetical protein [Parashewanella hymeniacidonis]
MDIFEEAFSELGIEGITFGDDNVLTCELSRQEDGRDIVLSLSAYRDHQEMSLRLSVTTQNTLPDNVPGDWVVEFGERAIEPFRGGFGIGVLPECRNVTVYRNIIISGKPKGFIKEAVGELIEAAEEWDLKLYNLNQANAGAGKPGAGNPSQPGKPQPGGAATRRPMMPGQRG